MNVLTLKPTPITHDIPAYDDDLKAVHAAKDRWAITPINERIKLLKQVKKDLMDVAEDWVLAAGRNKQIKPGSPLLGEEWISGPYAVMSGCNGLIATLSAMKEKKFLNPLKKRNLSNDQMAVQVLPHSIWDRLLLSGVYAEIWMKKGVNKKNLKNHAASAYDVPEYQRTGKVALILGAGNIAAITPLDAFQKLFLENQVVIIKMNPVNEYLTPYLRKALSPLIAIDAVRIVQGNGDAGAYLCEHDLIDEIHITGARSTHDKIVWGIDSEAHLNKRIGTPKNKKRITSELGAVCPTIVVPGPWSAADIKFQAENIATQKMHNSGYNCVACQILVLPEAWRKTPLLLNEIKRVLGACERGAYYPGGAARMADFASNTAFSESVPRKTAHAIEIGAYESSNIAWLSQNEVFGPAMATKLLASQDAESYLRSAIAFANAELFGTLGANIVIHPKTIREIGKKRFEAIISELRYGTIAINTWTGVAFLATTCPWGGYPNSTLADVGSGIGNVHNTYMLEETERTVIRAPWRPFPRGLLSGQMTLLPKPPWFITNKQQHHVGKLLTRFQYKPSFLKLPRIFAHALLG